MIHCIFLILFAAAAVLHLIGTVKGYGKLCKVTKPMLLSSLCLYCVFRSPSPDLLLTAALFACFIGDVLLMLKGDGFFVAGGIAFAAGHFILIFIFARDVDFTRLPFAVVIPAAVLYAAAAVAVTVRTAGNTPKPMRIPFLLYLLCNGGTNVFALVRFMEEPGLWTALSFSGAVMFFLSDCALLLMRSDTGKKRFYKTDFFVMLTYIAAVLLITVGIVRI